MFVKQNRKNWEKNATERNGTGQEMEQNGMGEETLQNRTKRPVCSHPVFIKRASHSKGRTGGDLFTDAYCTCTIPAYKKPSENADVY